MSGRSHRFLGITSTFGEVSVSCSRKQHGDLSEGRTSDLSLWIDEKGVDEMGSRQSGMAPQRVLLITETCPYRSNPKFTLNIIEMGEI